MWPSSQWYSGASAHGHASREHDPILIYAFLPSVQTHSPSSNPEWIYLGTRDHGYVPGSLLRGKGTPSALLAGSSLVPLAELCTEPAHTGPTTAWQSLSSPQETAHFAYSEWYS